ncbi:MAG: hypothetical protein LBT04_02130 [Prevotellaceae bacterium]|nr:hypothetical protein [Prevotellaceae bacterium]
MTKKLLKPIVREVLQENEQRFKEVLREELYKILRKPVDPFLNDFSVMDFVSDLFNNLSNKKKSNE